MNTPIKLDEPLSWKEAKGATVRMLRALQGNILKGHGRHFAALVFFRFSPLVVHRPASRRFLRELANHHVTDAHQQLLDAEAFKVEKKSAGAFVHVALSHAGYVELGVPEPQIPADSDFRLGMKHPDSLAALADDPADWQQPFLTDLHGVVLVAHDTDELCRQLALDIEVLVREAQGSVVHVQHGAGLFNSASAGIEHFGYVDGRSQPLMLAEDVQKENDEAGMSRWNAAFGPDLALVPDPGVTAEEDKPLSFGSYFVFRKLGQDVLAFKRREQALANALKLSGEQRELAGALVVGRFEDGTPVTLSDHARGKVPPNDFDYGGDAGKRCPFHAHIRKTNPRGSGGAEAEDDERRHLMPRRGIPYEDVKRTTHPNDLPEAETEAEFETRVAPLLPSGSDVGLLFMAYNSVIGNQFRFTQELWVNNPSFPFPGVHGLDPLIGQGPMSSGDQKMFEKWDDPGSPPVAFDFAGFVKMKGGEYFFSPSLNFLREL